MNIDRLTEIAEWLEGGAKHTHATFSMKEGLVLTEEAWMAGDIAACGTSCCIAGAAVSFFASKADARRVAESRNTISGKNYDRRELEWAEVSHTAGELLDLEWKQQNALFNPPKINTHTIDSAWAARTVRRLIATGKIDWEATR